MEFEERMKAVMCASPDVLKRIDAILEGGPKEQEEKHHRLLTIAEGRRFLGWSYPKIKRAIDDGLLDVVVAMGSRLIKEESLYELAEGRRQPSAEVLARREARNAARREEYRLRKVESVRAARVQ